MTNTSPREKYQRTFEETDQTLALWKQEYEKALLDSIFISLPYSETGLFSPGSSSVYSYDFHLNQGEELQVEIEKAYIENSVFIDLFQKVNDTVLERLKNLGPSETILRKEITTSGIYKLVVQPEIAASTPFRIGVRKKGVYGFPVAATGNSAIQSYWGASRDGGRRSHEGIDIFAKRGTPVVAVTPGYITSTGNKGLGGKQVWLRDQKRGTSLYYAHLDSIIAIPGMKVKPGDTLGLVGNSGNAKTTPPHLHFGIYKGYRGAQDPLPYVFQTEQAEQTNFLRNVHPTFVVSKATANLRKGPSTKAQIAGRAEARDTLKLLGKSSNWYHTRLGDQNYFIHETLAAPL